MFRSHNMWSAFIWVSNTVLYWWLSSLDVKLYDVPKEKQKELFYQVAFNQVVVELPTLLMVEWWLNGKYHFFSLKFLCVELSCFICITEALFYWIHRLFHTRFLYTFHQVHHQWVHPISMSASFTHPVEHFFLNLFPIVIGPLCFQSHPMTIFIWSIGCTINTLIAHAGIFDFHHTHHRRLRYNFGITEHLDAWFGTLLVENK